NARGPLRLRLTGIGSGSEPGGVSLRRPRIVTVEPVADRDETAAEVTAPSGSAGRRPIVLWVVDTLRADRLGPHGGPVPTPHLDAFAAESLVFERAIAQSSWTKASMGSVFTGRSPLEHGAYRRDHVLSDRAVTLAELLSAAGYRTAAFGTNPNLTEAFGFAQGFDHFVDLGEAANAGEVVDAAVDWLRTSDDERPLFLWLHPIDPHSPYVPPDAFREEHSPHLSAETARRAVPLINDMRAGRRPVDLALVAEVVELYDTEIAWSDRAFGRLREALADASLDDAIVLVLSDHGEEFYEHGNFEHGRALFAESIHVPFMLHWPEGPVGRVREAVQHLDVLPTLLDAVGVEAPRGLSGQSLLDGPPTADRPIFSHLHLDGAERVAVERGRFKLLAEVAPGDRLIGRQLYDLVDDPKETRNLAAEQPIVTGRLATLLRKHLTAAREGATVETVEIDEETRRRLEALGYL
ncbi:MAG: sulfatase, partial [Acidobacteriota bacterium]